MLKHLPIPKAIILALKKCRSYRGKIPLLTVAVAPVLGEENADAGMVENDNQLSFLFLLDGSVTSVTFDSIYRLTSYFRR
jgi:hypothetical protein